MNQIFKYITAIICLLLGYISDTKSQGFESRDCKAKWISCAMAQDKSNSWIAFRRTINLNEVPSNIILNISVDTKYWLYINGELVVFEGGLKRGPNPKDTYYDVVDLTKYLKKGSNSIAVLTWYFGKNGFSHHSSGRAGLLLDLSINNKQDVYSDTLWKCTVLPSYLQSYTGGQPNYRLPESNVIYDARLENGNWISQNYNDANWVNAYVIGAMGCSPWNKVVKRPIPLWKDFGRTKFKAGYPFLSKGDTIKLAFPYNGQYTPYLKVEAPAGKVIGLFTDDYFGGSANNVRGEYITKAGLQEYESLGWMNGHVMMFVIPKGIKILELGYRETGYDTEFAGSFSCNDSFYDQLWNKSRRTLYLSMRDTYMDCPDRERNQWWGDEVNELGESFYALDSRSHLLAKKGINELLGWQKADSTIFSPIPAGNFENELPMQMLNSVGYYGIWTYYFYSGDLATMTAAYPGIKRYLDKWKIGKNGLVIRRGSGMWGDWGDWGDNQDLDVMSNAWYYLACKGYGLMSDVLKKPEESLWARNQMVSIEKNFNRVFWMGKAYRSPGYKGQTDDRANALAVLAGLPPVANYSLLRDVLLKEEHSSPYMEKYVIEALFKMGYSDTALERLKKRYSKMVESNLTTLWEGWGIGIDGYGGGSYNHAWSGGGLTLLSQYVAGIEPAGVAFDSVKICPHMGKLTTSDATISSVAGMISVKNNFKNKNEFHQSVLSPSPLKIYFPVELNQIKSLIINGEIVNDGLQQLKRDGFLTLNPGQYDLALSLKNRTNVTQN
jgi:alpha-L-rhamnosidase